MVQRSLLESENQIYDKFIDIYETPLGKNLYLTIILFNQNEYISHGVYLLLFPIYCTCHWKLLTQINQY